MNRERELALQRVSRLGSISTVESIPQSNSPVKRRTAGALTIEAAIGTYMVQEDNLQGKNRFQDVFEKASNDLRCQEQELLSRQMEEYQSAVEEGRNAARKHGYRNTLLSDQLSGKELEKILAEDASARYQLGKYRTQQGVKPESVYDKLDANRCSGFLLYSYNKHGIHSELGRV